MKNLLILGLVAALLFSISAGLSFWLNSPKNGEETADKTKKKTEKEKKDDKDEDLKPLVRPGTTGVADEPLKLAGQLREQMAAVKEREARLERRQAQMALVLEDIRGEREVIEGLRKQVGAELKYVTDRAAELDLKSGDLAKKQEVVDKSLNDLNKGKMEIDANEKAQLQRMATTYDSMQAENAAKIFQQMADGGRMETAVKIMALMKERQAAKVLAEMSDPALAAQLTDKIRLLRRNGQAATIGNGG